MPPRLGVLWFVAACAFAAGCTSPPTALEPQATPEVALVPEDAQRLPHPAYGWPTASRVPPDASTWWRAPHARLVPSVVSGLDHLARVEGDATAGDKLAVFGRLAFAPGQFDGVDVFDLVDPEAPTLLTSFRGDVPARALEIVPYPDGRLVLVLVANGPQLQLVDVSDPLAPEPLSIIELPSGAHNAALVPGTPFLYNANSVGTLVNPLFPLTGGTSIPHVEIYDLTDPEAPTLVQEWKTGLGCHDISFHLGDPAKLRGYCAGLDQAQIWDLADPRAPTVISTFPFTHARKPLPGNPALVSVAHTPFANRDATVLGITDETLGGGNHYCDTATGPLGDVWFYDVSDEAAPRLVGSFGVDPTLLDDPGGWCLAHAGRVVPHLERDLVAIALYSGGVALVDFTDPAQPSLIDQWRIAGGGNPEPSDVWFHAGFLLAGDQKGGLDVLALR